MSHLDEVVARVDAAIEQSVIIGMNELLVEIGRASCRERV